MFALLFMVPLLNLGLFLLLVTVPPRPESAPGHVEPAPLPRQQRPAAYKRSISRAAVAGFGIWAVVGIPATLLSIGFVSAMVWLGREDRTLPSTLLVATEAALGGLLLSFVTAREGLICILMALPIVWAAVLIGALVGHAFMGIRHGRWRGGLGSAPGLLILLPVGVGVEHHHPGASWTSRTCMTTSSPPAASSSWRRRRTGGRS